MNRRLLIQCTFAVSAFGAALLAAPFVGSLRPGIGADASLPAIDVSKMQAGESQLLDHPLKGDLNGGYRWSILLIKHQDGSLNAWDVPSREGKIGMPDIHWWRPFYACESFGVTRPVQGGRAVLTCSDATLPSEYWRAEWQWTPDGKAQGQSVDDLQPTVGVFEGKYFVVGKRN